MKLTFKTDFWDQPELRIELIRFIKQIHNLDLSRWDQLGYWDRNHRPFSYFDGDRMVANATLFTMNMRVNGKDCQVAQMSGVGTDPEYRHKGLAYELDIKAMEWAREKHGFYYLFADEEAFRLYEKCGFRRVVEHKSRIKVNGCEQSGDIRKLDTGSKDDLDLIYRIACERTPVSNLFGVNRPKLLMFWCLYFLSANIYYIKELDMIIMMERKDELLTVFDIVSNKMSEFSDIYPFISEPTDHQVEFMFMPDRLNAGECEKIPLGLDRGTHLCGEFPLEGQEFNIPMTAMA